MNRVAWRELFTDDQSSLLDCPARAEIARQGDKPSHVFLIESGLVALTRTEESGRELVVRFQSPGWIFGCASVILEEPFPTSVLTLRRSKVRMMSAGSFRLALRAETGSIAWRILKQHSQEIHEDIRRMAALALIPPEKLLQDYFWNLASDGERASQIVHLPGYQSDLAEHLNITPQYLARLFRKLEMDGLFLRQSDGAYTFNRSHLWHRDDRDDCRCSEDLSRIQRRPD